MLSKFPEHFDPINSVTHNKQFIGIVNQSRLKRLAVLVAKAEKDIMVELNFFYDKVLRFRAFTMKLETVLELECQRSLDNFEYPLKLEIKGIFTACLSLTKDLPAEIEVFLLDKEVSKISLHEWIEEELLLSMPMVPINKDSKLNYKNEVMFDDELTRGLSSKKPNPFVILQGFKK